MQAPGHPLVRPCKVLPTPCLQQHGTHQRWLRLVAWHSCGTAALQERVHRQKLLVGTSRCNSVSCCLLPCHFAQSL